MFMWIFTARKLARLLEEKLTGSDEGVVRLRKRVRELKDELADLKTTKKMEEREIEHLVKIKEEKLNIEHQKRTLDLQQSFSAKEMQLQTNYHDKIMKALAESKKDMTEVHQGILKRLPNISASLEVKRRK